MAIRTLPTAPRRTDDPDTFIANTDAWLTAIPLWTDDVNTTAANINSVAAGGAYALSYKYAASTGPVGAAPGGYVSFENSATAVTATQLFIDTKTLGGQSVSSALLATVASNGSNVKGQIRLVKQGDATAWALFNVTGYAQNGGGLYGVFNVAAIGQSSASPFAANDTVLLFFQRTGDKGDQPTNSQFTPVDMAAGTNVNLALGNYFLKTINGNTTLTFSAPPSQGYSFVIEVTLTSGVLTLPASVTTANNSALTLTAGKTHLLSFFTSSTGTKWRMSSSVNYTT